MSIRFKWANNNNNNNNKNTVQDFCTNAGVWIQVRMNGVVTKIRGNNNNSSLSNETTLLELSFLLETPKVKLRFKF